MELADEVVPQIELVSLASAGSGSRELGVSVQEAAYIVDARGVRADLLDDVTR
jgi:hypothetical protein